jgi:hypothetical protein
MLDIIEDIEDILEHVQEVFEIENATTRQLMCNAMLHYFYFPVIVGSLSNSASNSTEHQVSMNTALFVLNKSFKMIKFQPLLNSVCIALMSNRVPDRFVLS